MNFGPTDATRGVPAKVLAAAALPGERAWRARETIAEVGLRRGLGSNARRNLLIFFAWRFPALGLSAARDLAADTLDESIADHVARLTGNHYYGAMCEIGRALGVFPNDP